MSEIFGALSRKVLVVEDDALLRDLARILVEDLGYEVLEADCAEMAIRFLEEHRDIRVVFTDINMSGSMDGLQLVSYAHGRWPPLQFIVVSGAERPGAHELPQRARFFPKPYDLEIVSETLRIMVEGARS